MSDQHPALAAFEEWWGRVNHCGAPPRRIALGKRYALAAWNARAPAAEATDDELVGVAVLCDSLGNKGDAEFVAGLRSYLAQGGLAIVKVRP